MGSVRHAAGEHLPNCGRSDHLGVGVRHPTQPSPGEQLVTQRKLDEILQALPRADNALIGLEEASDSQLATIHAQHLDLRADAVAPAPDS